MAGVRVIVNEAGILKLKRGAVRRYMLRLGNRILNNSRHRVNVDTGYLRSTGSVSASGDTVRVAYRARYARWVHDGTRPHVIRAAAGGVLADRKTGRVFGQVVHHPGYRGNRYLTDAMKEEIH